MFGSHYFCARVNLPSYHESAIEKVSAFENCRQSRFCFVQQHLSIQVPRSYENQLNEDARGAVSFCVVFTALVRTSITSSEQGFRPEMCQLNICLAERQLSFSKFSERPRITDRPPYFVWHQNRFARRKSRLTSVILVVVV